MDNGFITLHRKITDNPIWQNAELGHLFVHLLLMANHERKRILRKGQEEWIERGQLKTGQYLLAMQTGIPRGSIYYHLKTLENLGIVSIKASSKYSIITLIKYEDYQSNNGKFSRKVSSKLVTDKLHVSTNNNVTMEQELHTHTGQTENFFNDPEPTIQKLLTKGYPENHIRLEIRKFVSYWTEPNKQGKPRWKLQETFEIQRRLTTWFNNIKTTPAKGERKIWKQPSPQTPRPTP